MATLPSDNIVVGYAPGSSLQKLVTLSQRRGPEATRAQLPEAQLDQISSKLAGIRSLGFALNPTDKGLRLRPDDAPERQDSSLPAAVHAGPAQPCAGELVVRGLVRQSRHDHQAGGRPGPDDQRRGTEAGRAGRSRARHQARRPLRAASGDQALYAGPGSPLSAGVILHPRTTTAGAATLRALTKLSAGRGIKLTDTADGQQAAIRGFVVRWRAVDDVLGIGTDECRRGCRKGFDRGQ